MTPWITQRILAVAIFAMSDGMCSSYVLEAPPQAAHPASIRRWKSLGVRSFDMPMFPKEIEGKRTFIPSTNSAINIVVPDFDVMFSRMAEVSPLAKQVLENQSTLGFDAIGEGDDVFKWKTLESHRDKDRFLIHLIDKIDNFQGIHSPLLRFRSRMRGPSQSRGERFSHLLTEFEARSKWDPNIAEIYEIYPFPDMSYVDMAMGHKFGETSRCGVGYCRTKKQIVSPREQLTMCGVQEFVELGASIVWGVELGDDQNHLMPAGERLIRTRSHLFSTALVPVSADVFDLEYVIQLEVGKFPTWLSGPVIAELVKGCLRYANKYFEGGLKDGELAKYLKEEREQLTQAVDDSHSILITP